MISDELNKIFPKITDRHNYAYGDNYIAAKYCGLIKIPYQINGEWQHGWIVHERNFHPENVIGSDGLSYNRKKKKYFVARTDQEKYLKEQGYPNAMAIGLPIVYVQKPEVERIKGSLLVMPVHSSMLTEENWDDEEYAAYIDSIAQNFTEIVLCLHISCYNKGNWIDSFKKRNIEAIIGADNNDINSYDRLAMLFSRFEYVTSNQFGSHVAYAAYFGAKPSIAGPKLKRTRKQYENLIFYKNVPELLEIDEKLENDDFLKKQYPFLFVEPQKAQCLVEWAEFQLGLDQKKSPEQLKKLFGWTFKSLLIRRIKNKAIYMLKKIVFFKYISTYK